MTTVTQIITDAYRQSNLLAVGASPTTAQETEALRYLNRLVKGVFGNEAGELLTPIPVGSEDVSRPAGFPWWNGSNDNDWFVPKNSRLMLNLTTAASFYLHPMPNDGSRFGLVDVAGNVNTYNVTIHGNGRNIEDTASITLNTASVNSEWFYREDLGNWVKYAPLVGGNTFPFPEEFDDFFITMLAIRLNPSYGIALDGQSELYLRRSKTQLRARYQQIIQTRSEYGLTRMSRMTADQEMWRDDSWYNEDTAFNRGWPW